MDTMDMHNWQVGMGRGWICLDNDQGLILTIEDDGIFFCSGALLHDSYLPRY
jgi:hypothetical protein